MTNNEAIRQLVNGLMCSDVWNKLPTSDKVAIRKAITALRNVDYGYSLHEIDNGMPIRYFTKGNIKCSQDLSGGYYISVDGRKVVNVTHGGENCRGQRGEVVIYDNSIDKKILNEVIEPLLRDNAMLIHDAFDEEEWKQINKEWEERIRKDTSYHPTIDNKGEPPKNKSAVIKRGLE